MDPASAAPAADSAGIPAAPRRPASSPPFAGRSQIAAPPPSGSAPPHTLLAAPARTVPRLSSLRPLPILAEDLLLPDFCSGAAGLSGRSLRDFSTGALSAALRSGGHPLVLAEHEGTLEKLGIDAIEPPEHFWAKLNAHPGVRHGFPHDARLALEQTLPQKNLDYKVVLRRAGMGSLGQQRFVVIAQWNGGCIAREAKAMVPSSVRWLDGRVSDRNSYYEQAIASAVRAHDPFQKTIGRWIIRRLSPDSNPIDITLIPQVHDEGTLLQAMGSEAANVHLGTKRQVKNILKHLRRMKPDWLRSAAKSMAKALEQDWKHYKKSGSRKSS